MKRLPWVFTLLACLWAGTAAAQDPAADDAIPGDEPGVQYIDTTGTDDPQSLDGTLAPNAAMDDGDEAAPVDDQGTQPEGDADSADSETSVWDEEAIEEDDPQDESDTDEDADDEAEEAPPHAPWRPAFGLYVGLGPAFDLRDPATGYSARIGIDFHWLYFGMGLEVTWNSLWANDGARRFDLNPIAYKSTNSGVMVLAKGYAPLTEHFVLKFGAGIGIGRRYETIFSDDDLMYGRTSWLARAQVGALWAFDNNATIGLDIEFNFGNYIDTSKGLRTDLYWSDKEKDCSLGVILTFSYQIDMY